MKSFRNFINESIPRTLYVSRPVLNGKEIQEHYLNQGFEETTSPDKMHVTICYSKDPVDWNNIHRAVQDEIHIHPSEDRHHRIFGTQDNAGAHVLEFSEAALADRHDFMRSMGASFDYDSYRPHVTVYYGDPGIGADKIIPWKGPIHLGKEQFEEIDPDWAKDANG